MFDPMLDPTLSQLKTEIRQDQFWQEAEVEQLRNQLKRNQSQRQSDLVSKLGDFLIATGQKLKARPDKSLPVSG